MLNFFKKSSPKENIKTDGSKLSALDSYKIKPDKYNPLSYDILDLIHAVLSKEKDSKGKNLVQLVILLFEKMGYVAIDNDGIKDKKQDILIYQSEEDKEDNHLFAVIQCKSYTPHINNERLSDKAISELIAYTKNQSINKIYITTSFFNSNAIEAFSQDVTLIDRIGLIKLLNNYFPEEMANLTNSLTFYNDVSALDYIEDIKNIKLKDWETVRKDNDFLANWAREATNGKYFYQNCPDCKHGKLQKLYSKQRRYYWYKCMACCKAYNSINKDSYNLKLSKQHKY